MRELYESILVDHQRELQQVTAAMAVIATLDDIAWLDNRISLNDRESKGQTGKKRSHQLQTANRQYWKIIGRTAAQRLRKQLDAFEEGYDAGAPYRIVVYYGARELAGRDSVNLTPTTKAIVDGLVWGGLLPDDNHRWVSGQDSRLIRTNNYRMEVVVHILATPSGQDQT